MPVTDKINILVVDDLPEKLLVMSSVLADLGENVVTATSGPEALQHILQNEFAVILLDVNMPGMDGFETAALIRKRKRSAHVPIIFVTSYVDEMHATQGYQLGAVDYVLAPVASDILRTKVRVFVDLFRMTQQVRRQAEERLALVREQVARAAAEEANRRLAFLARAGHLLGRSLDYEATTRDSARLAVPFLADLSAITLAEPTQSEWKTVAAHTTGTGEPTLEDCDGRTGLPRVLTDMIERVLDGGAKELLPTDSAVSSVSEGLSGRSAAAGRLASLCVTTAFVLPLHARGRVVGTLALAQTNSGRQFGPAELTMAEALASRTSIALDNALLYSEVQRADRQKNEFLSMLAHELRNPLAPIRNAVQLLRRPDLDQTEVRWSRDVIDRQVTQMARLVDDLLDVSRITQGKIRLQMAPVAVSGIVDQAVETSRPLIDARKHRLNVQVPPKPLWVMGDGIRLAQVLTNLLNNAAKYTDEGGNLWLTVADDQDEVCLSVRDTGVGIPAAMLGSVFELFTQVDRSLDRSQGGLGIGLTLVRHLVHMHGGSVRAYSPGPNRGSEFVVRLPLSQAAELPSDTVGEGSPLLRPPSVCRVLVVDDNQDAAASLAMLLRLDGFEVQTSFDGPAALDAAARFGPSVVLLDLGLPGMDGYEVARRLRSSSGGDKFLIIAVTGYNQEEDRRRSREAGFDHFLVKPVDPPELTTLIADHVDTDSTSRPAAVAS